MRCKLVGEGDQGGVSKGKEKIQIFLNFLTALSHHPLALWFDKAMALGDLPVVSRVPSRPCRGAQSSPVRSGGSNQASMARSHREMVPRRTCYFFVSTPGWARTGTLTKTRADNT
jgi:hypothetical protein